MYFAVIPILFLIGYATAQSPWEYNIFSHATDAQPCITNCKNSKCITDWNGSTKACWTNNNPTPKYRTANLEDKQNQYCLSNCGFFGFEYQWCITTDQKGWDYCNAEKEDATIYKKRCTSKCSKGSADYYWCYVDGTKDWQYCAPAREGLATDKDVSDDGDGLIDPRHGNDSIVTVYTY